MKIGIDIDDTISNTYEVMFNFAQKFTKVDLEREINPPKEEIKKQYTKKFHGWSDEELIEFNNRYSKSIFEKIKPKMFAVEVIRKLKEEGNEIYIITSRFESKNYNIKEITKNWLDKNNIPYNELIINRGNKDEIVKEKGIEIFIDDTYNICKKVAESGVKTYMMNSIRNVQIPTKIKRIYSWIHIYQEINKENKLNERK